VRVSIRVVQSTGIYLLGLVCFASAVGQTNASGTAGITGSSVADQVRAADRPASVAPGEDALGAGDQLVLNIADLDEVKNLSVRIGSDGSLDLPLIGIVQAAGITAPALRQVLANRYSKYITNPHVSLQVSTSLSRTVSILGEVNSPGVEEMAGSLTLLGAISKAGGIRAEAGSQVIVTRNEGEGQFALPETYVTSVGGHTRAVLPLDDLLAEKSPQNNIVLQAGDVITIPKGSIVYVIGEVHKAGGFPLRSRGHVSLIEALALAEGMAPNAKGSNAKILRLDDAKTEARKEIPININDILTGKKPDQQLFADDILFVPTSAAKAGAKRAAEAILQVATGVLIYR
jgi:polysaccharide biosynthesis/export protein